MLCFRRLAWPLNSPSGRVLLMLCLCVESSGWTGPSPPYRPDRLVVDAHVVAGTELAVTARGAGVPFLIDPLTHLLQDVQYSGHPWTRLPFARPEAATPADLSAALPRERLVEAVVQFQLDHGATKIIAPYVHVERMDGGWIDAQARIWRSTRAILDARGESLPVIAVVALGWRCLHGRAVSTLTPFWDALRDLSPDEVAVAASKSHEGVKPDERLGELLSLIKALGKSYPVTLWQQGLLGEVGVVAGARGYECGIGWRERCDLNQAMALYRVPPDPDGGRGARPVYLADLGRSVPKPTIKAASSHASVWRTIICADPVCCPPAGAGLLGDARRHAIVARAHELAVLDAATTTEWAWGRLADKATRGLDLAPRLNAVSPTRVDTRVLTAIQQVAASRRQPQKLRVRRTA